MLSVHSGHKPTHLLRFPFGHVLFALSSPPFLRASGRGLAGPADPPATNKDGAVTTQDFFDYLNAWTDASIFTDWNYDGEINTLDFLAFLNDHAKGCP
ncbi:MAG: hypothetical protein AMXMBFR77_21460 [Phycisphaerales bacterium]